MMPLIFNEWKQARSQLLQHIRNGSGSNAQPMRQGIACHPVLVRAAESQDGLEVVVHRFTVRVRLTARRHG
jgi:hypothetical protein